MTSTVDFPKAPSNANKDIIQAYIDAANGDIDSQLDLGMLSRDFPDIVPFSDGLFFLTRAAESGRPLAMLYLAKIYLEPGDLHDFSKARDWYAIAAEHGDVSAEALVRIMDVLGDADCYLLADACEELYQIGSENVFDALGLGDSFFTGSDILEQDMPVAFRFYLAAALEGDPVARRRVGYMYEHGLGVEQSLEDAAAYYVMASPDDDEAGWLFRSLIFRMGDIHVPEWAYEEQ